jgi:hypothetical protein
MMTGDRVEAGRYVICGPDEQCMDQNINRWYCHRDSAGRCATFGRPNHHRKGNSGEQRRGQSCNAGRQ